MIQVHASSELIRSESLDHALHCLLRLWTPLAKVLHAIAFEADPMVALVAGSVLYATGYVTQFFSFETFLYLLVSSFFLVPNLCSRNYARIETTISRLQDMCRTPVQEQSS